MAKKPKEPEEPELPKNLAEVLKNKDFLSKFETFSKKEYSMENFNFLTIKSWNSQNLYKLYLAKSAKYELNLPAPLLDKARELGEKKAWDDREWKKIYEEAQKIITRA
ncbi:MAG: hypothetical protein ACRYG6_08720 [Janthinobacterium lividum]